MLGGVFGNLIFAIIAQNKCCAEIILNTYFCKAL